MQDKNKQKEIEIVDLLYRILIKWRIVLVVSLIGCILGCFVQIYNNRIKAVELTQVQDADEEMIMDGLSIAQVNAVEDAVDISMNIEELKQYLNDSIYMNLNPYKEDVVTLCYTISVEDDDMIITNKLSHLLNVYRLHINNLTSLEGYDQEVDLTNLFDCKLNSEINCVQDYDNMYIFMQQNNQKEDTLIIYIKGSSKEMAEDLSKALQVDMENFKTRLEKSIGQHGLQLVSEETTTIYDQGLELLLDQEQTKLTGYNTNLTNYMTKFTDNQKKAYMQLLNEKMGVDDIGEQDSVVVVNVSLTDNLVKASFVGFIFGMIIVCGLIILRYLTDGLLKETSDLTATYNLFVQGDFSVLHAINQSKNKLDKWIIGLKNTEHISLSNMEERTIENVKLTIDREGMEQVVFTSSFWLDDIDETFLRSLMDKVNSNAKLIFLNDLLGNVQALEASAKAGGIVLVEKIGSTRYQRMNKMIELCNEHGIRILGVVVL